MALPLQTFSNKTGGNIFYKAVSHPLAAERVRGLLGTLAGAGPVAILDPLGHLATLAALYDLSGLEIAAVYVQDIDRIGEVLLDRPARPVTELPASGARAVLLAAFDAARPAQQIRHLLPAGAALHDLDACRLPETMLSDRRRYLAPINFAVNHALFRDGEDAHTRIATANYWSRYGAAAPALWCRLYDGDGTVLAQWEDDLPAGESSVIVDSAEIRRRFDLPPFAGQLFVHVVRGAGHDVVKYALDTYGDDATTLSCTHDANAWPAEYYAGLPAPDAGERVILWIQNVHPTPVPDGAIGLNEMGDDTVHPLPFGLPPFGTRAVDVATVLPGLAWPRQIELRAGNHLTRPRYEVERANGRRLIAHMNVERTDLEPDPRLIELGNLVGKGFILPAPLLPVGRWRSTLLPTPMATRQTELPVVAVLYDTGGREIGRHAFGRLARRHDRALDLTALAAGRLEGPGYGHVELVYDFSDGGPPAADGWLHALFRYEDRETGHGADTSFGSHMFNMALTYKGEPQSYGGPPPGLTTRLFLRLGDAPVGGASPDTLCHLIYPASTPWHAESETELLLMRGDGTEVARTGLAIPCGGSRLWRSSEMFDGDARARAGARAYVIIRDQTCRLFGYHGLIGGNAFSLDHMFGF